MIELTRTVLGYPLTVSASPAGDDWTVTVLGGCAPHTGSVSLAEWKNGAVCLRTLTRDGHRDQVVGDRFARVLAEQLQCTVCVVCGIHYDAPSPEDLRHIVACADRLLTELCAEIQA